MASVIVCKTTSPAPKDMNMGWYLYLSCLLWHEGLAIRYKRSKPSECAIVPLVCGTATPPMTNGFPSSSRCKSQPAAAR